MKLDKHKREKLLLASEMVRLSLHVYGNDDALPEGWTESIKSSPEVEKKTGFFGELYEKKSPEGDKTEYAIAFRGTTLKIPTLIDDVKVALGSLPRGQYDAAIDFVEQVCKQKNIKPTDIKLAGHSLGGHLAEAAGLTMGAEIIVVFNSPGLSNRSEKNTSKFLPEGTQKPKIFKVGSSKDFINVFGNDDFDISGMNEKIELDTNGDYGLHHSLKGLVQGISDALDNKPTPQQRSGSLPIKVANLVSERMTNSGTVKKVTNQFLKL